MTTATYHLAPFVPGLEALGADRVEDLLGTGTGLRDEARARLIERQPGSVLLRIPLPGTPEEEGGPFKGRPRGAGTGWVFLRRYQNTSLVASLRARFSTPRSASLADREWNLLCHLRGAGVTTPEPMAVGSDGGAPVARCSFLVTRELPGDGPLLEWLDHSPAGDLAPTNDLTTTIDLALTNDLDRERRRRVLAALALTLKRVALARVHLGALAPEHLLLVGLEEGTRPDEPTDGCAAERILAVRARQQGRDRPDIRSDGKSLRWRCLPDVAIMNVVGGRIMRSPNVRSCLAMLEQLADRGAAVVTAREALTLAARTLRALLPDRAERHPCLRRMIERKRNWRSTSRASHPPLPGS